MNRFDRTVVIIFAALLLAIAGIWVVRNVFAIERPEMASDSGVIGAFGPISMQFAQEMDTTSVIKHLAFEPMFVGDYTWHKNRMFFWPFTPLTPGTEVKARLDAAALTQDGRSLGESQWTMQVRQPMLAYLAPSDLPEVWIGDADGANGRQLTSTSGRVYDFTIDKDGETFVYSAQNDLGGVSMWQVGRDGGEANLVLDCGADWCINPAFKPRSRELAYTRRTAGITPGSAPGVPRIWILDLDSGSTSQLYANPNVFGSDPLYSPDGTWLAFHDGMEQQLRLVELASNQEILIPTSAGMTASWNHDGLLLYYNEVLVEESSAYRALYRFNPASKQIERLFADDVLVMDEGQAEFSPDGRWMLLARGDPGGNSRRELWLFDVKLTDNRQITNDPLVSIGAYRWSPDSAHIAVQTLEFGASDAKPGIRIIDRSTNEVVGEVQNASMSIWVP